MGTHTPDGKGHGIAFHDGEVGLVVFLVPDMMNIFGDIDLSGTRLTARGQAVGHQVHVENSLRRCAYLHDPLGAGLLAGPTAHTFLHVDHRKTLGPQFEGVKLAGPHARPKAETPHSTLLRPGVQQRGCPAIFDTHIIEFLSGPEAPCAGIL
jgi:hypothetical protein